MSVFGCLSVCLSGSVAMVLINDKEVFYSNSQSVNDSSDGVSRAPCVARAVVSDMLQAGRQAG